MAVFALSINAFGATPTEADFWKESNLTEAFFHKFINNERCHSTPEYEKSCQAALQAARGVAGGILVRELAGRVTITDFEAEMTLLEGNLPAGVPVQMMRANAITAHLHQFDPYAGIMPIAQLMHEQESESAAYVGIGVNLERNPEPWILTVPTRPTIQHQVKPQNPKPSKPQVPKSRTGNEHP